MAQLAGVQCKEGFDFRFSGLFFHIFFFIVAIFDLVHDVETIVHLP